MGERISPVSKMYLALTGLWILPGFADGSVPRRASCPRNWEPGPASGLVELGLDHGRNFYAVPKSLRFALRFPGRGAVKS